MTRPVLKQRARIHLKPRAGRGPVGTLREKETILTTAKLMAETNYQPKTGRGR